MYNNQKITPRNPRQLQQILESLYNEYNCLDSISEQNPDPLLKVYQYKTHKNLPYIALVCALFSYGNVRAILNFLDRLDFGLLDSKDAILESSFPYYRFQTQQDVQALFLALYKLKCQKGLENIVFKHYNQGGILQAIRILIREIHALAHTKSRGFDFLVGSLDSSSPLKRWNMYMRWLVRKDNIDLGIWYDAIYTKDLLLPLDTHTFRVCQNLGLLHRKSYDIKAVLEVSESLRRFDRNDPIKYDFSLYRIGQNKMLL